MGMAEDTQFEEHVCERVGRDIAPDEPDAFDIKFVDGWSIYVENSFRLPPPNVGDTVRLYGKGLGFPVRGIVSGDKVYRYQTADEWEAAERERIERRQQEQKTEWVEGRPEFDSRLAKLPSPFQERINFFLQQPDWGWQFGGYELFACEQAALFAEHCKTSDGVRAFHAKPYEKQRAELPGMSDEHSGNTFGMACQLAIGLIEHPDLVPKMHGALCGLTGCEEYGCWAARKGVA